MKTQTTNTPHGKFENTTIPPAVTRALRSSIQADKLASVLFAAGATKLRGTPTEVLEEVAAAQTAAWLVGFQSAPMSGPVPAVPQPDALELAMSAIDKESLDAVGAILGIRGTEQLDQVHTYLAANIALTAVEATRFASAEDRPVCHNCVAVGGSTVARNIPQAPGAESEPIAISR